LEVATFVNNVSQFEPGESSGQCAAFCAAQVIRMAEPGRANASSAEHIDQLAGAIYRQVTGQITEPVPINPEQLKAVLAQYDIKFEEIEATVTSIDAALAQDCPVIVMAWQDSYLANSNSPYAWDTTGILHAVILSGMRGDGYEVRDSANPAGNPAIYDKRKMRLYHAIKIIPKWRSSMQLYEVGKGDFDTRFVEVGPDMWQRKGTTLHLIGENLKLYKQLSIDSKTLPVIGLPIEDERYHHDPDGYAWSTQQFERATMHYDPLHRHGSQPGCGASYLAHVNPPTTQIVERLPEEVKERINESVRTIIAAVERIRL